VTNSTNGLYQYLMNNFLYNLKESRIFQFVVISIIILNAIVMFVPNHGLTIEYMRISDYIILVFAITLLGLWLGLRFYKKVFHQTVIQSLTSGGE